MLRNFTQKLGTGLKYSVHDDDV